MRRNIKRSIFLAIIIITVFSLIGCGTANGEVIKADNGAVRDDISSIQLTQLMGQGISLGNTMESYAHEALGVAADIASYETFWGEPVTTQEMIDGMKAAGFDTLRIPVSFSNTMNFEGDDFTIREDFLARLKEIVDYARNVDMYVIITEYKDGDWWGMFGSSTEKTRTKARNMYRSMWTQIAEYFKGYSDYVIFEGGDEELGDGFNDNTMCEDTGNLTENQCYDILNEANQLFVDSVRSTGGNNMNRFLIVPGYNCDIDKTCDSRYKLPDDTASDKIMVAVHYFGPENYTKSSKKSRWGSKKDYQDMNRDMYKLQIFTGVNVGVVITEYAVQLEDNRLKTDSVTYYRNLLNNCDWYDYCPVLKDAGDIYNKEKNVIPDNELAFLFMSRNQDARSDMTPEEVADEANRQIMINTEDAYATPLN